MASGAAKPSTMRSLVDKMKSTFSRSKAPSEAPTMAFLGSSQRFANEPASFAGTSYQGLTGSTLAAGSRIQSSGIGMSSVPASASAPGARVMIVGARGLQVPPGSRLKPYASCEVLGVEDSLWTTPCVENTSDPIWEEDYQMPAFRQGTQLAFNVYNADPLAEPLLLGHCVLASDVVHPYGYSGELPLEDGEGALQVKVTITGPGVAPQGISGRYPTAPSVAPQSRPAAVPPDSLSSSMNRVQAASAAGGPAPVSKAPMTYGGGARSIKVAVLGAHAVRAGLDGRLASRLQLFCVCGVTEKPHTANRTRPISGSTAVTWNEEFDIPDYLPGDALEFVLMQVDPQSGEEILGMALLSDAQFGNFGYNAELTLACPGTGIVGLLTVRVTIPGAQTPYGAQTVRYPAGAPYATAYRQPADGGLFSMLDLNGDGVITRSEFAAAVGAPAYRPRGSPYMPYRSPAVSAAAYPVVSSPIRSPVISPAASFVAPPVMSSVIPRSGIVSAFPTAVTSMPAVPLSYVPPVSSPHVSYVPPVGGPMMGGGPVSLSRPSSFQPSSFPVAGPPLSASSAQVPYPWGGPAHSGPVMPRSDFCPSMSSGVRPASTSSNIQPGPRTAHRSQRVQEPSVTSDPMVVPTRRNEAEMGYGSSSRQAERQSFSQNQSYSQPQSFGQSSRAPVEPQSYSQNQSYNQPQSLGQSSRAPASDLGGGLTLPVTTRSGRSVGQGSSGASFHQPPTLAAGVGSSGTQRGGMLQEPPVSRRGRPEPLDPMSGGGGGFASSSGPRVRVALMSASGLRAADFMGKSDPYCTCEIEGKPTSKVQTQVIRQNLNPRWNEEFELLDFDFSDTLLVQVFDKDEWPKKDDFLGECRIPPGFIGPQGLDEVDFPLENAGTQDASVKLKVTVL